MSNPAPSLQIVLSTWQFSPVALALILATTIGYLGLVRRHGRGGTRWPVIRTTSWLIAMVFLILAADSALGVYADNLFWVHMLLHLVMIMIVPALLVWAQPIRLLHDAGGPRIADAIDRIQSGRTFGVLTSVRLTVPLYFAVLVLTHLTGFQQAMATNMWIHEAELVLYLVSGYLLLLPLMGNELVKREPLAHLLRFVVLAACMGVDTLVGITLMMTGSVIAPAYAASRAWGPSALSDQTSAGAIMWFGGDGLMMVLMVVVVGQWIGAGNGSRSLGPWLDGIRSQATLGDFVADPDSELDDDQAALDAYNRKLAALNGTRPPSR